MKGVTAPSKDADDPASYSQSPVNSGWSIVGTKNDPYKMFKVVYDLQEETKIKTFRLFTYSKYMETYNIYKYSGSETNPKSDDAGWASVA